MFIKIIVNDTGKPLGKLADAELHFAPPTLNADSTSQSCSCLRRGVS